MNIIESGNLTKSYCTIKALDTFSIKIEKGEFAALLGANGAGKSTFIRLLLGLEQPDPPPEGGQSMILGCTNGNPPPSVRQKIGYISDDAGPVEWATVQDLADFYSSIYGRWDWQRYEKYTAHWKLDTKRKLKGLSKGQKRLAEFALVLSYQPELLVLDEPFNGIDAVNRIDLQQILRSMQRGLQTTILYTTHVLDEVERLADRLIILREGRMVEDVPMSALNGSVETLFRNHYGIPS